MLFKARGLVVSHVERLRREAEQPVEPPPHEVLGLSPNATTRQIEDAWGIFARQHASDRGAGQERFLRGYKAYRALLDAKLKQAG
jgi:curved DNA-binding protein CbpA